MNPGHEQDRGSLRSGSFTGGECSVSVEILPEDDQLPAVFEVIEEFGERAGWSMEFVLRAQLILEEMVLNVMNHSGATDPMVMRLMSGERKAAFEIIDRGIPFDPTQAPTPPERDASSLEDMAIGGLGIHLVRSMVQEMRYRRAGSANHLTLVLSLPDA